MGGKEGEGREEEMGGKEVGEGKGKGWGEGIGDGRNGRLLTVTKVLISGHVAYKISSA